MPPNDTTYTALTESKIAEALSFIDYDDRDEWVAMAMCIKSELGESGFDIWNNWSSQHGDYKIGIAKSVWRTAKPFGGRTIGTLIFMAQQSGFKISDDYQRISKEELKKRESKQQEALRNAELEAQKLQNSYKTMSDISAKWWDESKPATDHAYLSKKSLPALNLRTSNWRFYLSNHTYSRTVENTLLVPLYDENEDLVSVQGILPSKIKLSVDSAETDKMYLRGAKKSGTYSLLRGASDVIYIVEGWATGATVSLATDKTVYIAMDSGNLSNVAKIVRKKYPLSRIIIAADNDQFKKTNSGIKQAIKASTFNDCDVIYPRFKNLTTKPTDFDDLRILEGLTEVKKQLTPKHHVYKPHLNSSPSFNAFKLPFVSGSFTTLQKNLNGDDYQLAAGSAFTIASMLSKNIPVSMDFDQLKQFISTDKISHHTITSIMARIRYMVDNRHRLAMTAVKPKSWKKHNYLAVADLSEISIKDIETPMVIVTAPTAAGKTKNVIKPFCDYSKSKNIPFLATAPFISLISDLSSKLGVDNYAEIKNSELCDNMAICLPSIESKKFKPFVDRVNALAIDEISQVLRFTSSKICSVHGADSEQIFYGLRKLMNECGRVVVADASIDEITLDSIEQARPEEKFTIVEKLPDRSRERKCIMYERKGDLIQKIINELVLGGKVWVSVESATMAQALRDFFENNYNLKGKKVIALYSDAKKANKTFYEDMENQSKECDVVIASPTISSGVSIEHRDSHHFTMIAGFANGTCKQPTDFMQMLARVRYVNDYHVCMEKNSINNDLITAESLLLGFRQAAQFEGGTIKDNDYSNFMARVKIADEAYKSDFAAGFYWLMQYYCFDISFIQYGGDGESTNHEEIIKGIKKEHRDKFRDSVKAAPAITYEKMQEYKQEDENQEQVYAWFVRSSLGIPDDQSLDDTDLDMFENLPSLDRFSRLKGFEIRLDDSAKNIALRKFSRAQEDGIKRIFGDMDITTQVFNADVCKGIVDRISTDENRFYLSAIGLIPKRYGQWIESHGQRKAFNQPKDTMKAVGEIINKFGLEKKRVQRREDDKRGSDYVISSASLELMTMYATRRNDVFAAKYK